MKLNAFSHEAKALHFAITGAIAEIAYRALSSTFGKRHRRRQSRKAVGRLANLNEYLLDDIDLPREQLRRMKGGARSPTSRDMVAVLIANRAFARLPVVRQANRSYVACRDHNISTRRDYVLT